MEGKSPVNDLLSHCIKVIVIILLGFARIHIKPVYSGYGQLNCLSKVRDLIRKYSDRNMRRRLNLYKSERFNPDFMGVVHSRKDGRHAGKMLKEMGS